MIKLKMKNAVALLVLMSLVSGCAGHRAFKSGRELIEAGKYDEAVAAYFRATKKEPGNDEYRMRLIEARSLAAQQHLKRGRILVEAEDYKGAAVEFEQAAALDPSADIAMQELRKLKDLLRAEELLREAEQFYASRRFAQANNAANEALQLRPEYAPAIALQERIRLEQRPFLEDVELELSSTKPITLKFKDADVREVFNILNKLSGINFLLDEEVRSQRVTLLLEDASFAQTLELLLNMGKLNKKVLNSKTIIIYPKTKEKDKQFEDHIIQTFYLSNIDAKKAVNLLRTMLQLRKIYVHEELNALVIRDTPEVIKLARQIIEAADRGDSEVLFDLELIEVSHVSTLNIGPKLNPYATSVGLSKPGSGKIVANALGAGTDTGNLVSGLSRLETFYTLPTATFDLQKVLTDTEILANPKIRVKNKEKAKVHVGSREPVVTTTINGDQVTENVQYIDVGVKLDIEANIQLDNSVVTKLTLEVSNKGAPLEGTESTVFPITTTTAGTSLTLRDGERTILGGLIRDDFTKTKTTIPFIGELPIIGDLISNHSRNKTKREILLSVTPHILMNVDIPRADVARIWSGGEDDLKARPQFAAFAAAFEAATEKPPAPAAPALQPAPPAVPGVTPPEAQPQEPQPLPEVDIPPVPETVPETVPEAVPATPVPETTPVPPPPVVQPGESRAFMIGPPLVDVGEEFAVEVAVVGMQRLFSAPLFVNYDSRLLEFLRAEEGDFLKQGGATTIFTSSANPAAGQLIVGYRQGAEASGASGSGTLFRLLFKSKAAGQAALGLNRINFRDPAGNRLPVDAAGISVEVR